MWRYIPVILAITQAEPEGLQIEGQPGQLSDILSQNFKKHKKIKVEGSSVIEHLWAQSPVPQNK